MKKVYDSTHFEHDVVYYVPCFQKNPKDIKDGYPTFDYSLADATSDLQMAYTFEPDFILTLKGKFDAKTQPFSLEIVEYNFGIKEETK